MAKDCLQAVHASEPLLQTPDSVHSPHPSALTANASLLRVFDAGLEALEKARVAKAGALGAGPAPAADARLPAGNANTATGATEISASDREQAERLKQEGNTAMQAGQAQQALQNYSAAIAILPENAILYSNRFLLFSF